MKTPMVLAAAVCGALLSGAAVSSADAVLDWNSIMVNTTAKQNPFAQARFAAITQLAVFEAVNAIDKDYEPYLGTITAPPGASAAASEAPPTRVSILLCLFCLSIPWSP